MLKWFILFTFSDKRVGTYVYSRRKLFFFHSNLDGESQTIKRFIRYMRIMSVDIMNRNINQPTINRRINKNPIHNNMYRVRDNNYAKSLWPSAYILVLVAKKNNDLNRRRRHYRLQAQEHFTVDNDNIIIFCSTNWTFWIKYYK